MCDDAAPLLTEIKRKLFHLTALLYVAGIIYLPRPTYVALLAAGLALVYAIDRIRLSRPEINAWFLRRFTGLLRAQEQDHLSGVVWMLAGVLGTAVLVQPVPLACAALLYLILGDGVASLAGMGLGGPHWPGSPKRISGSLACLVTCLIVGAFLLPPVYDWRGVVLGAAAATAFERGLLPGNDNLTIPVGASVVFMLIYGLRPLGF